MAIILNSDLSLKCRIAVTYEQWCKDNTTQPDPATLHCWPVLNTNQLNRIIDFQNNEYATNQVHAFLRPHPVNPGFPQF